MCCFVLTLSEPAPVSFGQNPPETDEAQIDHAHEGS